MIFICHKKKSVPCGRVPSGLANLRKGTPEEPTTVLPLNSNMTQWLEVVKYGMIAKIVYELYPLTYEKIDIFSKLNRQTKHAYSL